MKFVRIFFMVMVNVDFICLVASSGWLEARRRLLREKRNRWDPASVSDEEAHRPSLARRSTAVS